MSTDAEAERRRQTIQSLFSDLPPEYEACLARLHEISRQFHAALGAAFAPVLNNWVRSLPQSNRQELSDVTTYLNHELRSLHLAVADPSPKTAGEPCTLAIDSQDCVHRRHRIRTHIYDHDGKMIRTGAFRQFWELELVERRPRREPMSREYIRSHPRGPER